MGHEVVRCQENNTDPNRLIKLIRSEEPDLFMFTRTWNSLVTMDHLTQIREMGIKSFSYHLDLYVGIKRESGLDNDPFWRTDYVFTPDGDPESAKVFAAKGINHHYIKPGVYRDECYPGQKMMQYEHDVVFVGSGEYLHAEWPYRKQLLDHLSSKYESYGKYGNPERTVRGDDLNNLYASCKIVVGDSLCKGFDHTYYWSDRVYETLGRGGFIIHPYIKGMEDEFTGGENIVFYDYGNFDQLDEKIDYYLKNEKERETIRKSGHEFVKQHATYHNRLEQALGIMGYGDDNKTKINLGAGEDQPPGWINVDILDLDGIDVVHNLLKFPYPFEDEFADEIKAIDLIEHLPNYTPDYQHTYLMFIKECHRILKPGGKLVVQTPHWNSLNMWIDPTHVRGFDERSFDYFDPTKKLGQDYPYYSEQKFDVSVERSENYNLTFTMVKI